MSDTASTAGWGSRLGFILASAGSAVGLGAIWKFPYMAGTNGGSVFMLPYIFFTLTIGLALLIGEMAMGRRARGGAATAFPLLGGKRWGWLGLVSVATGYFVLAFYSVVGGWCVYYMAQAFIGNGAVTDPSTLKDAFGTFASSGTLPIICHAAFLTATAAVVMCGVEKGIERVSKVLMPLLFVLMLILIVRGLSLPGASEGLTFLFQWNPEAFTGEALLNAMGFAFFSLSVGSGSQMNYGSYLGRDIDIPKSTTWIVFLAIMSSILGGLMIMPSVFAFGLDPTAGPGLTFITMPAVFAQIPFGQIFAIMFYLCIVVAAVTSSVSMIEILVAFLVDEKKLSRPSAAVLSTVALAIVGALPCLSFGLLSDVKFFDRNFFDLFDFFTSNLSLPVGGLVILVLAGWWCWPKVSQDIAGDVPRSNRWFLWLRVMMLVVSPLLVLAVLVSGLM